MGTVLVVDDSAPVRQQVSAVLRQAGHSVIEAQDGQDGIDKLAASPQVEIVICDVNMPRMTGIEFLERMGGRLPVLMLTTEGQLELKKRAKELGAKGWIIKPFKPELLVEALKGFVRS